MTEKEVHRRRGHEEARAATSSVSGGDDIDDMLALWVDGVIDKRADGNGGIAPGIALQEQSLN